VLAASAERRGERLKGRNGVAEGGRGARSRPTIVRCHPGDGKTEVICSYIRGSRTY
jgi:hypothetical protein